MEMKSAAFSYKGKGMKAVRTLTKNVLRQDTFSPVTPAASTLATSLMTSLTWGRRRVD